MAGKPRGEHVRAVAQRLAALPEDLDRGCHPTAHREIVVREDAYPHARLRLELTEIFRLEVLEPLLQFLLVVGFSHLSLFCDLNAFRLLDDLFIDEDGSSHAEGQRDGVGGP